jgi:hypothetical protein
VGQIVQVLIPDHCPLSSPRHRRGDADHPGLDAAVRALPGEVGGAEGLSGAAYIFSALLRLDVTDVAELKGLDRLIALFQLIIGSSVGSWQLGRWRIEKKR